MLIRKLFDNIFKDYQFILLCFLFLTHHIISTSTINQTYIYLHLGNPLEDRKKERKSDRNKRKNLHLARPSAPSAASV